MSDTKNTLKTDFDAYVTLQEKGSDWSYGSGWGDAMVEAIKEEYKDTPPGTLLDIGCGEGRGVKTFVDMGFKAAGIDITKEKIDKGINDGLDLHMGDMHSLPFEDNQFDYVFTSHTLEHAIDIEKAVLECVRVARKEVFIIVPIYETKEWVLANNPAHTSPINLPEEFLGILDKVVKVYTAKVVTRMCSELWVRITLDDQK